MKKSVSLILVLILLFDLGGYYLWFSLSQRDIQKDVKREIRSGLKEEDLSLIIAGNTSDSALTWIKPNKEFRYKGEMYDVVKMKVQNTKYYYYCIRDTKEKQLIANYNKHRNRKKDALKKLEAFKCQFIPQKYSFKHYAYLSDFKPLSVADLYKSSILEINSPPPKL